MRDDRDDITRSPVLGGNNRDGGLELLGADTSHTGSSQERHVSDKHAWRIGNYFSSVARALAGVFFSTPGYILRDIAGKDAAIHEIFSARRNGIALIPYPKFTVYVEPKVEQS